MKTLKWNTFEMIVVAQNLAKLAEYRLNKGWQCEKEIAAAKKITEICDIIEKEKIINLQEK